MDINHRCRKLKVKATVLKATQMSQQTGMETEMKAIEMTKSEKCTDFLFVIRFFSQNSACEIYIHAHMHMHIHICTGTMCVC